MKKAFTLAEVLITLAIIGIVAALTIPTLVANYQKRQYVVQLQKVYSSLANAAKMVMADEQVDNLNNTYLRAPDGYQNNEKEAYENSVGKFLNKYFKVVKTCNYYDNFDASECIVDDYKSLNGGVAVFYGGYCGVLNSGSTICLQPYDIDYPMIISVDINGKKGPNVLGRDAFIFAMNYLGELSESFSKNIEIGIEAHKPEKCGSNDWNSQTYGLGCFNKIIQDGWKMDY